MSFNKLPIVITGEPLNPSKSYGCYNLFVMSTPWSSVLWEEIIISWIIFRYSNQGRICQVIEGAYFLSCTVTSTIYLFIVCCLILQPSVHVMLKCGFGGFHFSYRFSNSVCILLWISVLSYCSNQNYPVCIVFLQR